MEQRVTQLTFEHPGRLLHVEKLSPDHIRQFIAKRFGPNAESMFASIESIHDLSDLSTRPVLLDMILTTLPELMKEKVGINSAALYDHYTKSGDHFISGGATNSVLDLFHARHVSAKLSGRGNGESPSVLTGEDDHVGGIIRNNMIYRAPNSRGDVGISAWNSAGTKICHNTVILSGTYPNAIEYRFAATTGGVIFYNLCDANIASRDGATGTLLGNITTADTTWFVNVTAGDLHLRASATSVILFTQEVAIANKKETFPSGRKSKNRLRPDNTATATKQGASDRKKSSLRGKYAFPSYRDAARRLPVGQKRANDSRLPTRSFRL